MIKHLDYILLCIFFAFGLTPICSEKPLNLQETAADSMNISIENYQSPCSVAASTDCTLPINQRSLFNDEKSSYRITDVLFPSYSYSQNNAPSKLLRIFALNERIQNILSVHQSVEQHPSLSFTPNAIRYSHGYYIYGLAHILI